MNVVTISVICSIVGAFLGILGYIRYSKQDTQKAAGSFTRVETKLDYVSKGVDDIRLDIRAQDRKIEGINERLIRVEESTKSAHHRLDSIEEK